MRILYSKLRVDKTKPNPKTPNSLIAFDIGENFLFLSFLEVSCLFFLFLFVCLFFVEYVLGCHLISRFRRILRGESVAIVITGIPSYYRLDLRACSTEIFLVKSFRQLE